MSRERFAEFPLAPGAPRVDLRACPTVRQRPCLKGRSNEEKVKRGTRNKFKNIGVAFVFFPFLINLRQTSYVVCGAVLNDCTGQLDARMRCVVQSRSWSDVGIGIMPCDQTSGSFLNFSADRNACAMRIVLFCARCCATKQANQAVRTVDMFSFGVSQDSLPRVHVAYGLPSLSIIPLTYAKHNST